MEYRIPGNVFCPHCDYNVRGLPATGNCPECGAPIEDALRKAPSFAVPYRGAMLNHLLREKLAPVAQDCQCTIDGMIFAESVVRFHLAKMHNLAKDAPVSPTESVTALYESFKEYIALSFKDADDARASLLERGIETGEDFFKNLAALEKAKRLRFTTGETVDHFKDHFSLADIDSLD